MVLKIERLGGDFRERGYPEVANHLQLGADLARELGVPEEFPGERTVLPTDEPIVYSIGKGLITYYPLQQRFVTRDGREGSFVGKVDQLFKLLLENAPNTVDRETIARRMWGKSIDSATTDLIKKYVQKLRDKLELDKELRFTIIRSVPTIGYRLGVHLIPIYETPSVSSQKEAAGMA